VSDWMAAKIHVGFHHFIVEVKSDVTPKFTGHLVLRGAHYEPLLDGDGRFKADLTTLVDATGPHSVGNVDSTRRFYPLEGRAQGKKFCDIGTRVLSTTNERGVVVAVEGDEHRHRLLVRTDSNQYKSSEDFHIILLAEIDNPGEDVLGALEGAEIHLDIAKNMIYQVTRESPEEFRVHTMVHDPMVVVTEKLTFRNAANLVEEFGFYPTQEVVMIFCSRNVFCLVACSEFCSVSSHNARDDLFIQD
jgi:hypothetical protein